MEALDRLQAFAGQIGCLATRQESMKEHTTFKIGGPADLYLQPVSAEQCAALVSFCAQNELPLTVLGGGSNVLVPDYGLRGAVLSTGGLNDLELLDGCRIACGAGVRLSRLCAFALEHSLAGLEFAWGIPGTAGGAVYMNAGAYDGCFADRLESCEQVTQAGERQSCTAAEAALGYRTSAYQTNGAIITGVTLRLLPGSAETIRQNMDVLLDRRRAKQPLEYPSAGSAFQRPRGHYAGALIEQCGLKGCTVGGAQVSEKHAGFIINRGNATASDVIRLMEKIEQTVFDCTGVKLKREIRVLR